MYTSAFLRKHQSVVKERMKGALHYHIKFPNIVFNSIGMKKRKKTKQNEAKQLHQIQKKSIEQVYTALVPSRPNK